MALMRRQQTPDMVNRLTWGEDYDYYDDGRHDHGNNSRGAADYMDLIIPSRGPGYTIWDLPSNKLKTTAVAFTFVVTAGFITLLSAGGLLAILVTGAVVTVCVLLLVLVTTGLVAMIVTGVPVGYAVWQIVRAQQQLRHGWAGMGGGTHAAWED